MINKDKENNFHFKYKLTLLDFLRLYNFSYYDDSCKTEEYKYNTNLLRIVIPDENCNYNWIEIGVKNSHGVGRTVDTLQSTIKKEILSKYIDTIRYNDECEVVEVRLTNETEFID